MTHHTWGRYRAVLLFGLTAAAISAAAVYFGHTSAGPVFCADCSFETAVTETGRLTYSSRTVIELDNRYLLRQHIIRDERQLRLTGSVKEGSFDERIRGLVPGDRFDMSFAAGTPEDICPAPLSPLYPVALRRVLFLLPTGPAFAGKVWYGSFCAGRLSCRYEVGEAAPEGFVFTADCAGTLPENIAVTVLLRASFRSDPGRFDRVEGYIRAAAGPVDARWDIAERSLFDKVY